MSETIEAPVAEAPASPDPGDDLRAAIGAAWDEVESGASGTEAEAPAFNRERDDSGRFLAREQPADGVPPAVEAEAAEEPAPPAVEPPPPSPINAVLDEYKPLYASIGIAPEQAVRSLFEAQRMLQTRPVEAIQTLAREFGVDLAQFAPRPTAPAQTQAPLPNDPAMAAVYQKVQQLEQVITAQQQQAIEAENARVNGTIQAFAADPKHTHFPAVRQMMGALMQAGAANDMATAYEMACRAHPEVSKALAKAEAETRAKTEAEARRKAAAEAKTKAVSVRGSAPAPGFASVPGDIRGLLEAAFDGRLQ